MGPGTVWDLEGHLHAVNLWTERRGGYRQIVCVCVWHAGHCLYGYLEVKADFPRAVANMASALRRAHP